MSAGAFLFATASWLFLAGVVVQVLLAGLGAFKLTDWTSHAGFGWLLVSVPLFVLLPLGFVALTDRRTRWLIVLLVVSAALQPELALARRENPTLAALHPVNAILLSWLAWQVARASLRGLRRAKPSSAPREAAPLEAAPREAAASHEAATPGTPA